MSGPVSSAPPVVAVVVQQGRQLTGAAGSWSGSGAIKYSYQWYRCDTAGAHCASIHGATSRTYTLGAKDVGKTLGFAVRATDKTGTTNAYASLVGPVAGPTAKLVSIGQPTITGVPKEGQTLQVSAGSWSPAPAAVGYQWQRCNRERASLHAAPRSDREHLCRHGRRQWARPPRRRPRDRGSRLPGRDQRRDSGSRHRTDDGPVE